MVLKTEILKFNQPPPGFPVGFFINKKKGNKKMNNNEFGAKLAKETLTGDIAAFLIDRLRQFPKPYQQMSEKEQGELGKITIDKGLKCEIKASVAYADELIAVAGKPILIVTNSDDEFTGGENNLKADPDQREMFNACNSEYQDADGEGVPDPVAAEVPALEDHSVVDAEFEEVEDSFRDDNDAA